MAILDRFKKKRTKEEAKIEKKEEGKPQGEVSEIVTPKVRKEGVISEAYRILKSPHITEKATDLAKQNQYVFKIFPKANKIEVKKVIEDLYGVSVLDVKILNVPQKRRRLGRILGFRKGYKKAIVKIKEGQKIEVLPK